MRVCAVVCHFLLVIFVCSLRAFNNITTSGCPPCSYEDHLKHAREWKALGNKKERDEHFKEHGSRWADIMHLPYYDCIKMTVIDPMHNLLLGAVSFGMLL